MSAVLDPVKKSAKVFTVKKQAFEIEIFNSSKGFLAQASRHSTQKGVFSGQYADSLKEPTLSTESAKSSPPRQAALHRPLAGFAFEK
ncbi:hypothetical protein ACIQYF_05875 [Pseudomonas sp. NPDC096917]|uniref:hypothetical protein n=1 Tax=Pseudomonas sp. NPDC096917 TaxID=3364483 RepID=UPI00383B9F23